MTGTQKNFRKCLQNRSVKEWTSLPYPVSLSISCPTCQKTDWTTIVNITIVKYHFGGICLPLVFINHLLLPTFTICQVLYFIRADRTLWGMILSIWGVNFQSFLLLSEKFYSHQVFCVVIFYGYSVMCMYLHIWVCPCVYACVGLCLCVCTYMCAHTCTWLYLYWGLRFMLEIFLGWLLSPIFIEVEFLSQT